MLHDIVGEMLACGLATVYALHKTVVLVGGAKL